MSIQKRSPSDVVTITGLSEHLARGWQLHIVCNKEPELRGYQWYGSWYLLAVDPATKEWVVLVTVRNHRLEQQKAREQDREERRNPEDYAFRDVKTFSGLVSLLRELGFPLAGGPMVKGSSIVLQQPQP